MLFMSCFLELVESWPSRATMRRLDGQLTCSGSKLACQQLGCWKVGPTCNERGLTSFALPVFFIAGILFQMAGLVTDVM